MEDDQAEEMWAYADKCSICGNKLDENGKCKDRDNEEHKNAS